MRERDLALEVPPSPLEAVMSGEVWQQVYARLAELTREHRTTLVFVNTRRMAERVARHLSELIGKDVVTAHHGSLAKERRLDAEQRLKRGELRALVATASLELGIDIGDVELVCQLGTPRSIATFLQRAGRANHTVGGQPKARLFPLSRDELVECTALLDAVRRGELDRVAIPAKPLDVLAQQIVAEVAAREWSEDALFGVFTRAYPYATLTRDEYLAVVRMLAEGFSTRRGHRAAYVHRDAVNGVLRGRRGARLTAITSGGAIPDTADYDVVLEPAGQLVGTVNEDFAIESLAGDIFQLGNTSYRILRVEAGRLRVEDAHGQPPNIPFWLGEAPGRTDELSFAVSRLREDVEARLDDTRALDALTHELRLGTSPAEQLVEYLAAARAALGTLPTQKTIVFERFFDESGGMQLVIHSPVRQPHQPRVGPRAAQALLPQVQFRAAGGGHRGCDRAVALDQPQLSARRGGALSALDERAAAAGAGDARRADVRRALALDGNDRRSRCRAFAPARRCRRSCSGWRPKTSSRRCFPIRSPAPKIWSASARFPIIRSSIRPFTIVCTRRWTSRGWSNCSARSNPARFASCTAT